MFWRFQVQFGKADKDQKHFSVPQCMEIDRRPPQLLRELEYQSDQSVEHIMPAFFGRAPFDFTESSHLLPAES